MSVQEDLEGATDWSEGEPAAPSVTGGPQHLSQDLPGLGALGALRVREGARNLGLVWPPIGWVTVAQVTDFPVPQFPQAEKEAKSDPSSPSAVVANMAVKVSVSGPRAGL